MIIRLKYFHDNLNIVVIFLPPGREFFILLSVLNQMKMKLNGGYFPFGTIVNHFCDKCYIKK